ncbi:MAG: hypothetical protein SGJ19_10290, partial [Planctomycetia bacterium]|nr:hypothetical protein [Planctomycetia bacterium]
PLSVIFFPLLAAAGFADPAEAARVVAMAVEVRGVERQLLVAVAALADGKFSFSRGRHMSLLYVVMSNYMRRSNSRGSEYWHVYQGNATSVESQSQVLQRACAVL